MIISDYSIGLKSSHELTAYSKKEETLVQWTGDSDKRALAYESPVNVKLSAEAINRLRNTNESRSFVQQTQNPGAVNLNISGGAIKSLVAKPASNCSQISPVEELSDIEELKVKIIEELLYSITGKKIKIGIFRQDKLSGNSSSVQEIMSKISAKNQGGGGGSGNGANANTESVGWGIDYHAVEESYEKEDTSFSASGLVKTADGREIKLDIKLMMSREFYSREELSIKAGDALIDPLVINFSGTLPNLDENARIEFDLNMDGRKENIAGLSQGSGYLALDKNGDGRINDGSELFGPSNGNGFDELASYDSDRNGWLDENDSAYYNLRIWNMAPDGSETLLDMGDAGIGAIYLGRADTEFSMTAADGALNGKIRETGLFLRENGTVGTVQEMDIAV
ncbi:MAG: hypothetical protein A2020_13305 [Lentisphaerae bacterium GWF2_45_14]|nr:MAG: hypothetical protein A2020_13305 [Lentisphaerae bacterium GWF2_45_14]